MTEELANSVFWHAIFMIGLPFLGAGFGFGYVAAQLLK